MSTFIKTFVVAAALFAGANSIAVAAPVTTGLTPTCDGSFSPHGIWDCR